MLNPLPGFLDYAFFAPTLLRLVAAAVFVYLAMYHFKHKQAALHEISILHPNIAGAVLSMYTVLEGLVAFGLFFGAYTQIAALVGMVICIKVLFLRRALHHTVPFSRSTYVVLGVVCFSLLLTGAGAFAFDLPL